MSCLPNPDIREPICSPPGLGGAGGVHCFWEDQTRKNGHPSHVASFTPQALVFCPLTASMDAKANTSSRREPSLDLKINP